MISKPLMLFLLAIYLLLATACILDKKYWLSVYWIGAIVLNIAIYKMNY